MLPYAANKAAISSQVVGADSISARGVWCKREIWRVRIVVGAHSVRPRADASIRPYSLSGKNTGQLRFSSLPHLVLHLANGTVDAGVQHAYAEQRRPGQTQQRHQHQHAAQVQLD